MKRFLFSLLIGLSSNLIFAQDIIIKQNGDDCSEDGDILATQSQVWYDDFGTRRVGTTRVRVECK